MSVPLIELMLGLALTVLLLRTADLLTRRRPAVVPPRRDPRSRP
ncbi:hypothetical protein [Sulfurisoma sediminicola]|uniref:Uncharacterized protein n=1 Tax=Sulfurisoma sediminicola TaxID=1381557 RepID=A0A497XFM4_9PROT|nr:hypothetical protein [Sulfurisoma sediminicola]RLJ64907.1 hypothetical protein DFR35_1556 [Sulfurisoma sediminicola]